MGQYKVPQDVEAEDTILGPYTLKQFIYAVIGVAYALLTFQIFKHVLVLFLIVGVPPSAMMLILGLYKREGQPFEAYFLALVNYWFKPRTRIWLKENVHEVFKIEQPVPSLEEAHRDPREVRGQLEKLAQIVDTRGWTVKTAEVQEPDQQPIIDLNDRLATNELTMPTPAATLQPDVSLEDDMLDMDNNQSARNLGVLIQDSEQTIHQEVMEKIRQQLPNPAPPAIGTVTAPQVESHESKVESQTPPIQTPQLKIPDSPLPTPNSSAGSISEMTVNPIADILKRAMETPDLKLSQVSQIAAQAQAQAQAQAPGILVEGQAVEVRPEP